MARKPQKLPDYFTTEEASAPSYPTLMAMRVMLPTGPRVGETLSLRHRSPAPPRPADHLAEARGPEESIQAGPRGADLCQPGDDPRHGMVKAVVLNERQGD